MSLKNTLGSLNADLGCKWHCSGNDAFGTLLALQLLLHPADTQIPVVRPIKRNPTRTPGGGVNTTLGVGHLTPSPRSPRGAPLPPSRLMSGYSENFEAPAQGSLQQGNATRRTPGHSTRQLQQVEPRTSPVGGDALAKASNEAAKADVHGALRTNGRSSKRNSLVPVEVFRMGANRLSQLVG